MCAGKGHGDECAQRGQEDAQVSKAGRSPHPPAACTSATGVGTGRGQHHCVGISWAHTEEMETMTASYIHPPPGLPALVALSSAVWLGSTLQRVSELLLPFVHISANPKHSKLRFLQKS